MLGYIKRKWLNIRDAGGFSGIDGWCLQELADGTCWPSVPLVELLADWVRALQRLKSLSPTLQPAHQLCSIARPKRPSLHNVFSTELAEPSLSSQCELLDGHRPCRPLRTMYLATRIACARPRQPV